MVSELYDHHPCHGFPQATIADEFQCINVAEAWDKWSARFKNYHTAAELEKKKAAVQVAILLELAGPDALPIHKTFTFSDHEKDEDYKVYLQKFGAYCRPRKNLLYECYKYWKHDQEEGETISTNTWLPFARRQPCVSSGS